MTILDRLKEIKAQEAKGESGENSTNEAKQNSGSNLSVFIKEKGKGFSDFVIGQLLSKKNATKNEILQTGEEIKKAFTKFVGVKTKKEEQLTKADLEKLLVEFQSKVDSALSTKVEAAEVQTNLPGLVKEVLNEVMASQKENAEKSEMPKSEDIEIEQTVKVIVHDICEVLANDAIVNGGKDFRTTYDELLNSNSISNNVAASLKQELMNLKKQIEEEKLKPRTISAKKLSIKRRFEKIAKATFLEERAKNPAMSKENNKGKFEISDEELKKYSEIITSNIFDKLAGDPQINRDADGQNDLLEFFRLGLLDRKEVTDLVNFLLENLKTRAIKEKMTRDTFENEIRDIENKLNDVFKEGTMARIESKNKKNNAKTSDAEKEEVEAGFVSTLRRSIEKKFGWKHADEAVITSVLGLAVTAIGFIGDKIGDYHEKKVEKREKEEKEKEERKKAQENGSGPVALPVPPVPSVESTAPPTSNLSQNNEIKELKRKISAYDRRERIKKLEKWANQGMSSGADLPLKAKTSNSQEEVNKGVTVNNVFNGLTPMSSPTTLAANENKKIEEVASPKNIIQEKKEDLSLNTDSNLDKKEENEDLKTNSGSKDGAEEARSSAPVPLPIAPDFKKEIERIQAEIRKQQDVIREHKPFFFASLRSGWKNKPEVIAAQKVIRESYKQLEAMTPKGFSPFISEGMYDVSVAEGEEELGKKKQSHEQFNSDFLNSEEGKRIVEENKKQQEEITKLKKKYNSLSFFLNPRQKASLGQRINSLERARKLSVSDEEFRTRIKLKEEAKEQARENFEKRWKASKNLSFTRRWLNERPKMMLDNSEGRKRLAKKIAYGGLLFGVAYATGGASAAAQLVGATPGVMSAVAGPAVYGATLGAGKAVGTNILNEIEFKNKYNKEHAEDLYNAKTFSEKRKYERERHRAFMATQKNDLSFVKAVTAGGVVGGTFGYLLSELPEIKNSINESLAKITSKIDVSNYIPNLSTNVTNIPKVEFDDSNVGYLDLDPKEVKSTLTDFEKKNVGYLDLDPTISNKTEILNKPEIKTFTPERSEFEINTVEPRTDSKTLNLTNEVLPINLESGLAPFVFEQGVEGHENFTDMLAYALQNSNNPLLKGVNPKDFYPLSENLIANLSEYAKDQPEEFKESARQLKEFLKENIFSDNLEDIFRNIPDGTKIDTKKMVDLVNSLLSDERTAKDFANSVLNIRK